MGELDRKISLCKVGDEEEREKIEHIIDMLKFIYFSFQNGSKGYLEIDD